MKRSMIATALTLVALVATGCGASPTAGVPYKATTAVKRTSTTNTAASAAATVQVGSVALQLSSLKADALELKLSGPGLSAPLTRRMTADELSASNTVTFDNLPVGSYSVSLTAFDATNKNLGSKSTQVAVQPQMATKVGLQLTLTSGSLAFTTVDGDAAQASTPATRASTVPATQASTAPAPDGATTTGDANAALGIEVTDKQIVRKYLILKKLAVTVKVTNHNPTETLSGTVKIDFYATSGIISKTTKLSETIVQDVKNLAPGKSVELTIQSTKSAVDAQATVNTVVASASAVTE